MPTKPPRLSIEQFKERAKEVGPDFRAVVPKAYSAEVEKASGELEGDRRLQFTISTGSVDRHEDTVNPEGCTNLKSFQKTGVVLWAHDSYLPPIGKPIKAWSEDGKVKSVAEFSPPDLDHPLGRGFGSTVFRYFVEQYLKSVSIGFLSADWQWSEERDWGIDFNKWELLEFSPVPIPANKEALVELAKQGEDLKGIFNWASKCLDSSPSGLLVPRTDIEGVYNGLADIYSNDPVTVEVKQKIKGAISWDSAHPDGTPVADKDEEWDAGREVAEAETTDLDVMCAWKDDDAENKGDYKLPHHKAGGDHAVVWNGVTAGMGALLGARGGVDIPEADKQGVYDHLARHYREDFDTDPPELKNIDRACPHCDRDAEKENKHLPPEYREKLEQLIQTKKGRVLSAKNEKRLRDAFALIGEVLDQLSEEAEEEEDDKSVEPVVEPKKEEITRELVVEALQGLVASNFIQTQTEKAIKETLDRRAGRLPATTD